MRHLATPRRVLREVSQARVKPWWIDRLLSEITRHLERTMFRGAPIIDTPMSAAACDAVLKEALDYVQRPRTDVELFTEMKAELARMTGRPH